MKMLIKTFDFYKKPISLPIESETKKSTLFGSLITIITVAILSIHFYYESHEVFTKNHPTVLTTKKSELFDTSPFILSKESLNFYIKINPSFERENLLDCFNLKTTYYVMGDIIDNGHLKFTQCNEEDQERFRKFIPGFNLPYGIALCPRIEFKLKADSFKNFGIRFSLQECKTDSSGCKTDKDLYEKLNNREYFLDSYIFFLNGQPRLDFYNNPFTFYPYRESSLNGKSLRVSIEDTVVSTPPSFGYSESSKLAYLRATKFEELEMALGSFVSFDILLNTDDTVFYHRKYKTLTSAFVNTFTFFQFYSWLFSLLLNGYYTFNIEAVIINKNFEASNLDKANQAADQTFNIQGNLNTIVMSQKGFNNAYRIKNRLDDSFYLKKIACCNKKNNKSIQFYNNAVRIIRKHLSVEQLFSHLIELTRLKLYFNESRNFQVSNEVDKLVLDCNDEMGNSIKNIIITGNRELRFELTDVENLS
jgi:hypothetical protein